MKQLIAILTLAILFLAACAVSPGTDKTAIIAATQTAQIVKTPTPTPMGTWETVIQGVIYDNSAGPNKPILRASISYQVLHSYFFELQEDRHTKTITDEFGRFSLPVMVHDTDHIRTLIEAPGYLSYEEKLVGIDLFGGRSIVQGLDPLMKGTVCPP